MSKKILFFIVTLFLLLTMPVYSNSEKTETTDLDLYSPPDSNGFMTKKVDYVNYSYIYDFSINPNLYYAKHFLAGYDSMKEFCPVRNFRIRFADTLKPAPYIYRKLFFQYDESGTTDFSKKYTANTNIFLVGAAIDTSKVTFEELLKFDDKIISHSENEIMNHIDGKNIPVSGIYFIYFFNPNGYSKFDVQLAAELISSAVIEFEETKGMKDTISDVILEMPAYPDGSLLLNSVRKLISDDYSIGITTGEYAGDYYLALVLGTKDAIDYTVDNAVNEYLLENFFEAVETSFKNNCPS